jgi:Flp pilus assembly protein TadD
MRIQHQLFSLILLMFMISSCSCQGFDSEILYKYAERLHNEGRFEKAIQVYKRIVKDDPKNAIVQYDLGVAYVDLGDLENAEKQAQVLLKLEREDLATGIQRLIWLAKTRK